MLRLIFITASVIWAQGFLFEKGETLSYEINYGFTVGTADLIVKPVGTDSLDLIGLARSNGFFKAVYPVRDTLFTRVDKKSLMPSRFVKVTNEMMYHSVTEINISDSSANMIRSVYDEKGRKELESRKDTSLVLEESHHVITSAFYYFRTLDLKPGSEYVFNAVSGKKKYPLKVIIHKKETIEVPAGTFDCVVVEPVTGDDGIFQAKGKMLIWITDDERRLPVLVESKIAIGSISVELSSWKQNK